ncbi:MAG TPA: nuclear transport factor 2 family protein [Allosphingosinicella sp.]|jgi:ketosteroid isomerase-like protein
MVRFSVRATALGALLFLGTACAAQDRAPAAAAPQEALSAQAAEAAATVDAFHAALRRGDTAAASALLTEDVLVFEEGRAERSKSEYAVRHLGADAEFSKAVSGKVGRRRGSAAGDFAWIATEGRTRGSFRGTEVDRVTDETMVLRRIDGAWKIVHIHWSSAQSSVE